MTQTDRTEQCSPVSQAHNNFVEMQLIWSRNTGLDLISFSGPDWRLWFEQSVCFFFMITPENVTDSVNMVLEPFPKFCNDVEMKMDLHPIVCKGVCYRQGRSPSVEVVSDICSVC